MANQITDIKVFLESAKQEVLLANEFAQQEESLNQEFKKVEKELQAERKSLASLIETIVSKRRTEVASSFDAELNSTREALSKVKNKRQKEKNVKVKSRIGDETADLLKENQDLKRRIKDEFKKDKIPAFCNSSLYFSLFFPSGIGDFLKLFFIFIIFYAVIPLGIYYYIPNHKIYHLIVIYLLSIFIFGGIWAIIRNFTKLKHLEALRLCRNLRRTIGNNKKKMELVKKSIKGESDDAVYALDDYDNEIFRIEREISLIQEKRQGAIDTFECETKLAITQELQNASAPTLQKLESEFSEIKSNLEDVSSQRKLKAMYIADRYEGYLGREFLSIDKLDRLLHICEEGEFHSISELLEQYRNGLE